jgi:hypothetical protein
MVCFYFDGAPAISMARQLISIYFDPFRFFLIHFYPFQFFSIYFDPDQNDIKIAKTFQSCAGHFDPFQL